MNFNEREQSLKDCNKFFVQIFFNGIEIYIPRMCQDWEKNYERLCNQNNTEHLETKVVIANVAIFTKFPANC